MDFMAGQHLLWRTGESLCGSRQKFFFLIILMYWPQRDHSKKLTCSNQWNILIKQRLASAWCCASFISNHQSFCSRATANVLAVSWGWEKCQHSSKAEHVTPETWVLHEIKVVLKALYSWEILFIINIYITTPLLAKHMFTFFHSVSLRDSAGQRFFRALEIDLCFQLLSIYPWDVY